MNLKKEIENKDFQRAVVAYKNIFESLPGLYMILLHDLAIITASDSYLKATLTKREKIVWKTYWLLLNQTSNVYGGSFA